MKLRADDQAAQPQKREISSSYFPAESYQTEVVPFFFPRVPVVLWVCTGPGSFECSAIWNKLVSSKVTQAKVYQVVFL